MNTTLRLGQVMDIYGVKETKLRALLKSGTIASTKRGGCVYINSKSADNYFNGKENPATQQGPDEDDLLVRSILRKACR